MTIEATPAPQSATALDAGTLSPSAHAHASRGAIAWSWVGLATVMLAGLLLFWVFEAMPFMDLPAHGGLIAVRHRFATSPFEEQFFVLAPHIGPYSVFRFLGEAFVGFLGPIGAVRALATLPAIATPAALLFARRRLQGDRSPTFGYFGVILSYGLMTLYGFASYLLGVAVMLFALTLWLELMVLADERSPQARRAELIIVLVAPLVFVAHGHAFLLFLALAGVSAIATGDRVQRILRLRALTPALLLAAYVWWLERGSTVPAGSVAVPNKMELLFQGPIDKLSLLIAPTLMTRSGIDLAVGVIVWGLVFAGVFMTVRHLRIGTSYALSSPSIGTDALMDARARLHSKALLACMATLGVVFLVLPHQIGWFGFVDGRLVPIIVFLGLMSLRMVALGPTLRFAFEKLGPVFAVAVVLVAFIASYRFQDEARGYKEVLAAVPANTRLLNMPIDPNSDNFTGHPFVHYDKLALADRPVVVSDVWFHQGSALYPRAGNPALTLPDEYISSDLHSLNWPAYRLEDWDYVLVRTRPAADSPVTPASLSLVEHRGGWWLYRNAAPGHRVPLTP